MKRILSSRRDHYLAKFSIFLITVALIAGMVGCGNEFRCYLTIAITEGGTVVRPSEGTFSYYEGAPVKLMAQAEKGYKFVEWTGDVDTIDDVNEPTTTITMNGDYSITANFALEIIEIYDWDDLHLVWEKENLGSNCFLMNDLDSTTAGYNETARDTANGGKGWEPIGTLGHPFTGSFNGQGYEIRDLVIKRPHENYVGLFGLVDDGGVIEDIGVVNATVAGEDNVGGLVGRNDGGNVSNSYSTGSVTGEDGVGGLVGWNNDKATVSDSYSTGSVTGKNYVGGLVGENQFESTVSNSYSTGSVTGNVGVGGLVGFNDKSIVRNSHYNKDEVLINGKNIITIGALLGEDFEEWLANDKFLDVNERLSQEDQEDGYYMIDNVNDFKELLAFGQDNLLKFRLKNDLDLATEPDFYIPYLAAEFDGDGHKISNLSFNFDFVSHVGLFGCLAPGGGVSQVNVENVNITGTSYVGGLVGANWEGTVSNSHSTGSMTGDDYVGGLVGCNYEESTVSNSNSTSTVTGNTYVGGLLGNNGGTVDDSYSTGSVTRGDYVGGLVGYNLGGTVNNSSSTGSVTGDKHVGGLVGYNKGGSISMSVSNSYSTGNVSGDECVGGLVGYNKGARVSNSYSRGNVTGSSFVGGLVGQNKKGTVNGSYSTGSVIGEKDFGGLVGENDGEVSRSFWDTQTSGQATSAGGTGKITTEMKSIATFTEWNITTVANLGTRNTSRFWNIVKGVTYPFLSWEPV